MNRIGYICGVTIAFQFIVIVCLLVVHFRGGPTLPTRGPALLSAHPCTGARDVTALLEPGAPDEHGRYYLHVDKAFAADSLLRVAFDTKVNVTFTTISEHKKNSRITVASGKAFTLRLVSPQPALGLVVQAVRPGPAASLMELSIDGVEFCQHPDVNAITKYEVGNETRSDTTVWFAGVENSREDLLPLSCGRRVVDSELTVVDSELTVDGAAPAGAWPWLAAVYDVQSSSAKYYCGGTLVATNLVLTAGHCTANRKAEDLIVRLGRYVLSRNDEEFNGIRVREILTPSAYNPALLYNDIALLKLARDVSFSASIQPACLWPAGGSPALPENITGTIVSWGYDENDNLLEGLQQANMPIVSNDTCIRSEPSYSMMSNENNFCAGYHEGTSVCEGDSGIALQVFIPDTPRSGSGAASGSWHVKGVLSYSGVSPARLLCEESLVVFTDVDKFRGWILSQVDN